jgi:hypothetical protein
MTGNFSSKKVGRAAFVFASREVLTDILQKLLKHALSVPAGILFIVLAVQIFISVTEIVQILEDPVENFRNYPFGAEGHGYNYESERVYFASAFIHAYICIQALIVGVLLDHLKHRLASFLVMVLPFLLYWYIGQNYGAILS